MDEESLFRDIHNHLIHQAQEGGKMDTEMKLAERFNVSRYRVRRVLDILTRMGIIHRAQKRGLTVLDPEPEKLSKNIGSQLTVSGFNAMEDLEARMLIEHAVLELAVKRLTPMTAGRLTEKVGQLVGKRAIEAGIKVYNRTNGKPIVNSADAGSRISYIDLAAANDAICIALCSADGIAKDNDERMHHCHTMLDRGMALGMEAEDLWFDPLFLVVKGMQDKQMDVLNAIKLFSDEGLKSTGGLSNNSNGAPKTVRPIMDSALVAMAMMQGLTSAIVNPNDLRLMETIKSCDIFKNNELYSDSYLDA